MEVPKGFFASMFDFSFREFITIKIIKVLYGILIFLSGLGAIGFIVNGFRWSTGRGVLYIFLSPIVFLLSVLLARVYLEIIMVIFRIAENTQKMADK